MIKRSLSLLLITALCVVVIPDASALTAKAGAKCTKVKATSVVKGKKYTCIKSGKKLIWNKGVAVKPAAKPTSKPTPTPSPAVTLEGISQIRADALVGMSESMAEECAQSLMWGFRVGQRDSEMFAMTMDYRFDRVTVMVVLGLITSVNVG